MIPRTQATLQTLTNNLCPPDWQKTQSRAFTDPQQLLEYLGIAPESLDNDFDIDSSFPLKVPQSYVNRMKKGNPHDPLLLQVLPLKIETEHVEGYSTDPVGDLLSMPTPGVLKKYNGRALFITTGACGVHCRYCFRRHFPYSNSNSARDHWSEAINDILLDTSVNEVILSGGDPLCLSDDRLATLMGLLNNIPHVKRIRFHTRLPVVLPERINESLINWLQGNHAKIIFTVHINHANEINQAVKEAMQTLLASGVSLFNQSVLLRNINDNCDSLINLSEALFDAGITPYYLHMLDKVKGSAHFDVSDNKAKSLINNMRQHLPGYLIPRLVREKPGEDFKTPL